MKIKTSPFIKVPIKAFSGILLIYYECSPLFVDPPKTNFLDLELIPSLNFHPIQIDLQKWEERGIVFLWKRAEDERSSGFGWCDLKELNLDLSNEEGSIRINQSFIGEAKLMSSLKHRYVIL